MCGQKTKLCSEVSFEPVQKVLAQSKTILDKKVLILDLGIEK